MRRNIEHLCVLGVGNTCGDKAESKSKQKIENKYVNESTLNLINQTSNSVIVNTIVKNAKSCSASLLQDQTIIIEDIKVKGDFNVTAVQDLKGMLSFSCIQQEDVYNEVANKMISQILADFNSITDNSSRNDLNAIANSKSEGEIGDFFSKNKDTKSKVDQKIKNDFRTSTNRDIKSIVDYAVTSNFTSENISTCIAKATANQYIRVKRVSTGGNFIFAPSQKQAVDAIMSCLQASKITNKITNDIASFFDLKIRDDVRNTTDNTAASEAISETITKGPLGAIGDLFSGLFSPLTDLLAGLTGFKTQAAGVVGSSLMCCIIIIVLCVLCSIGGAIFKFMNKN